MHKIKILFLFIFLCTKISANEISDISITDVWISEAPPFVQTLAAYAKIRNQSNENKILDVVSSSFFSKIEIHQSIVGDGMAKMEKHPEINIDANSEFDFTPGGYHLMLFDPSSPLKSGDKVPLIFSFTDGSSLAIDAKVIKRKEEKYTHEHHHN